jgi:hypothetical protein
MVAIAAHLKLFYLLCLTLEALCAPVTISGSSSSNWPSTGGASIYLTGQIGPTNASCTRFKTRAGGTAAFVTSWISETSIAFRPPSAASSRIVFVATSSTSTCTETEVPVPFYPVTHLAFTKVVAGQGMGCAITSGGALYCWGCFSGMGESVNAPAWRRNLNRGADVTGVYHCISDTDLPSGPFLPTLVPGMESGVTLVTHLSTMGQYDTKQHMGLALKSGKVYELYLDTSKDFIASRIKNSFSGTFTVVADTRQQSQPGGYACALQGASVYCNPNSGAARISGLPDWFTPVSVHCSHFWTSWNHQHCCAYDSGGIVYCWGKRSSDDCGGCNRLGELVADITKNSILDPGPKGVAVRADVVSNTSIPVASGQSLVVSMEIGYEASYVVGGDGRIYCWSCRTSVLSLTKVADPPLGRKYAKLALYHTSRFCALTDDSSLYCAMLPSVSAFTLATMIQVTSVRNFKREVVPLASGVIDVSCSKNFGANTGYQSCCIVVRSSLGSKSGAIHCTVRATCTYFAIAFIHRLHKNHLVHCCVFNPNVASAACALSYATVSHALRVATTMLAHWV